MSFKLAYVILILAASCLLLGGCSTAHPHFTTLKDAYSGRFLIGTACDPGNFSDAEVANIKANYNVITPENCMKPANIHPRENTYNFGPADTLVQWCEDNHIQVIGHNLCWYNQTGAWFFQGADGNPVTRDILIERFKSHIKTVVGRYKGRIKGWDVVNEGINDGGDDKTALTENLRASNWLNIIGPDYLTMAFKWAHEADSHAELYYNDYNIESGPKHKSSMVLLKRLIADGAPITGVGIQGHWDTNPDYAAIEKSINDYKSLGLKVMITELDVTISGGNSGAFGGFAGGFGPGFGGFGGFGPGFGRPPATQTATTQTASTQSATSQLATSRGAASQPAATRPRTQPNNSAAQAAAFKKQADTYAKLFQLFARHADTITRVTLWGINDRRSWRAQQQPLLFDAQMKPKPAFQQILDAAGHR